MGTKTIEYNGRQIEMPSDATDEEVSQVLDQYDKVNRSSTFKQYKPAEPSSLSKLFIKWAPEWAAEEAKKAATGGYIPELLDIAGGATSTMRGALNMVSPGTGSKAFPTTGFSTGSDVNPNSIPYLAGNVVDPLANAIGGVAGTAVKAVPALTKGYRTAQTMGKTLPLTAEALARAGVTGAATGAGTAYLSSEGDLQDTGTGALYGGLLSTAFPVTGRAIKSGLGYVQDWAGGNLGKVQAGKIARAAAGSELPNIRAAMANSTGDLSASQAALGIQRDPWQALGKVAEGTDTESFYRRLRESQANQRSGLLTAVTPDLQSAEAARDATSALYPKAFAADRQAKAMANVGPSNQVTVINPTTGQGYLKVPNVQPTMPKPIQALANEPIMVAAAEDAAKAIRTDPRITPQMRGELTSDPMMSTQGLHSMKEAIEAQIKNPSPTSALAKYTESSLKIIRRQLVNAIEESDKGYKLARETFAQASKPVNQAKVLNVLSQTLENTAGGAERVTPFTNALGRGEESALKKAGIDTRFQKGISEVLTPQQMSAVEDVRSALVNQKALDTQAQEGLGGLKQIMSKEGNTFRLPNLFNQKVALANKFLEVAEKYISQDSLKAISEGMRSGKTALELLDTLPAQDRNKAALWINQVLRAAGEYGTPGAVIGSSSGKKENQ